MYKEKGKWLAEDVQQDVQERELVVNLPSDLETDGRRKRLQLRQEITKQGRVTRPESKDVVDLPQPNRTTKGEGREKEGRSPGSKYSMNRFARTGE